MANFFVYIDKAYCSEIALYRSEGITREECEVVEMPADTTDIYRVGELVFEHSLARAAAAFFADPSGELRSIPVVG